jgi:hypothetical protein
VVSVGHWLLPRSGVFHCATFSRKAGLPAAREWAL